MTLHFSSFKKKIGILLFLMVSCGSIHLFAQRLDTLINTFGAKYRPERIHLQFDKQTYSPQETIWFKGYIFSGIAPEQKSKNLYVDFSDETGKVLAHDVFPISEGVSRGQFDIPDSLKGNLIHVRAYTKWMLNFDTAFLYNNNLNVIQPKAKRIKGKPPTPKATLYFFPEGGDAIAGLSTRVAFMAEDQYAQPVNISGEVKDNDGNKVADLLVQHDGMGSFYFIPDAQKTYTATWKDGQGETHTTTLPAIHKEGITLSVKASNGEKLFAIQRPENAGDNLKELHVVATMYQQTVYLANISLADKTMISGAIPTAYFPSGILQITVLDKNMRPLAERIAFVKGKDDTFHPEVGFSKLSFDKRGANELIINVLDSVPANLAVSVTDASIGTDSSNNLVSDMLLSSQIKGKVYRPFYYFLSDSDKVNNDLDLVMLTHGWRRFDWDKIINKEPLNIAYPKDSTYLSLSGKVFGATPAQLAASGTLFAIIKSKADTTNKFIMLPLNSDGTFSDPNAIFFDSLNVYYKFSGKKNYLQNSEVTFMSDRLPSPGHIPMNFNDIVKARLYDTTGLAGSRNLYDQYWAMAHFKSDNALATVTVKTKQKSLTEKLDDEYTSGMFKDDNGYTFDVMNDIAAQGAMNVFSYLQGRVAGLQISNPMATPPGLSWRGSTPSLFLDEIPVSDASQLSNMSMSDIAMIKIYRPPFMGGFGGSPGGAIAVYTRKGADVAVDSKTGMPHKTIAGYTVIREFYSPNYLSLSEDQDKFDARSTLYWNSLIMTTPQKHEVRLKFFNNDFTKAYRIILEGINDNGQFTHVEKVIQ
ncbi:hypothetical protein [Arachidicoccus sp.]|uniref:hypothetical protein n=1 Tax=Arachidicoccus sp. TaxID=1872624 RepID=UPI003D20D77B